MIYLEISNPLDLATNWDIDIASELHEYIAEISKINIEFDGKIINFAQAAILIQSSSIVYCRKVNHLHTLLFQAVDNLFLNRPKGDKITGSNHQKIDGFDGNDNYDYLLELPSLDYVVDKFSGAAIDLKDEKDHILDIDESNSINIDPTSLRLPNLSDFQFIFTLSNCMPKTSHIFSNLIDKHAPQAESSTTKTEGISDMEASDPLNDASNLDSFKPSHANNGQDLYPMQFKLNSCTISPSGALVFSTGFDLFESKALLNDGTSQNIEVLPAHPADQDLIGDASQHHYLEDQQKVAYMDDIGDLHYEQLHSDQDDDDDHTDHDHHEMFILDNPSSSLSSNYPDPIFKPKNERERIMLKSVINPWYELDPHDPGNLRPRPHSRLPQSKLKSVNTALSKEMNDDKSEEIGEHMTSHEQDNDDNKSNHDASQVQFQSKVAGSSVKTLSFVLNEPFLPEFKTLYDNDVQKKKAGFLQERKRNIASTASQEGIIINDQDLDMLGVENDLNSDHFCPSNDPLNLLEFSDPCESENELCDETDHDGYNDDINFLNGQHDGPKETLLSEMNHSKLLYQELCRSHLDNYFRDAQLYMLESEISERISQWNERLLPLIEEQEQRPLFDMDQCGHRFIELIDIAMPKSTKEDNDAGSQPCGINLDLVFEGSAPYEVCRYFTVMLQLANEGKIEILKQPDMTSGNDNISVRKLDSKSRSIEADEGYGNAYQGQRTLEFSSNLESTQSAQIDGFQGVGIEKELRSKRSRKEEPLSSGNVNPKKRNGHGSNKRPSRRPRL